MPSPFPGVDPFIEDQGYWPDFHASFITCWRELLLHKLPERYDARLDVDVYIGRLSGDDNREHFRPDVSLVGRERPRAYQGTGGVALEEDEVTLHPVAIAHVGREERRAAFIEIRQKPGEQLVAVLELLSPANKTGAGRVKYLRKRRELRRARVHLIEVDLLMRGNPPKLASSLPPGHCHILMTRSSRPRICEVYTWNMQDPLPTIPVPLATSDDDIVSNLRSVYDLAFERGQYPRALDYSRPLRLPLDEPTRQWASEIAKQFLAAR